MANTIRIPVPDVAYARVSLPEIDIDDNPYQALEGAAAGIAGALAEREALDDDAHLNEAEADWYETAANYRVNAHRNGSTGSDQLLNLNDTLEERYKFWEAKTTKPALRKRLRQRFARMRFNALPADMRDEADARAADTAETAADTMRNLAEIAYYRPDEIGDVRDRARELREKHPEQADQLARQEQLVNEAYLRGLIETNPKLALETLRSRKGYAEEDLGIAEPVREALEHEAERATELESEGVSAAQDEARIGANLDTAARLSAARGDTGIAHRVYEPVRDAHKMDPKTGARLEAKVDDAHADALRRAERHNSVGRALVEGRALKWHADQVESLDVHIEAVASDGSGEATANARRVQMAAAAGRTPPKMQEHILKSLRATDPAARTGGLRMLQKLEEADASGGLTAWLPADHRASARRFAALGVAGFAEAEALKHLDAAKSLSPAIEEARRHHFDTYVRLDDLIDAAGRTYGVEPEGIAEDNMQSLEHHTDQDAGGLQTLEHDPNRDVVEWQPVLQKERGKIKFMYPHEDELCREGSGCHRALRGSLVTRNGTWVEAWRNMSGDRRLDYNCHGYTLAEGQFWIEEDSTEFILRDEFSTISPEELRPGDIVVYRDRNGTAVHSARIASVKRGRDGHISSVRVIGKLGDDGFGPVETDIDTQWPPPRHRHLPKYKGQTYERVFYRRSA